MTNRVLILRWSGSAYDSLGGLLELTAQELMTLGFDVTLFSADAADWPQQLLPVLKQGGFTFALTMSGIGVELTLDGRPVWEAVKTPLFNWNCDHPCYFPIRHAVRSPYLLHGYVFPDHARYNIRHLKPNGAAFAVHLGIPPRALFADAPKSPAARNGRVLFTKSGADTGKFEAAWRGYSQDMQQILFSAAEELFARPTADFLPVLQRIAEPCGIFLDGNSRLALLLLRHLDTYIRYRRANLVMRTVLRYPVDVCGTGWDHIDFAFTSARCLGATTWRTMIDQLPDYTACLSINPLVDESVHDRVFFALAAGVPPISDGNAFMRAKMGLLEPYMFGFTREAIEQAVDAVLTRPAEAIARADDTWSALAIPFGLRRSAQQIIQFATLHSLNAPCSA
jgi:hypothetical protein